MFEAIDNSATPFKPCGVTFASIRLTTVANKCGLLGAERERERKMLERNCELARSQIAWPSLGNQI